MTEPHRLLSEGRPAIELSRGTQYLVHEADGDRAKESRVSSIRSASLSLRNRQSPAMARVKGTSNWRGSANWRGGSVSMMPKQKCCSDGGQKTSRSLTEALSLASLKRKAWFLYCSRRSEVGRTEKIVLFAYAHDTGCSKDRGRMVRPNRNRGLGGERGRAEHEAQSMQGDQFLRPCCEVRTFSIFR